MKNSTKVFATVLAATIVTGSMAAPASAFFWKYPFWKHGHHIKKKKFVGTDGSSKTGPIIVGCVMGSAFGLITASLAKKTGELTIPEAQTIAFTCGLGAVPVVASFRSQ